MKDKTIYCAMKFGNEYMPVGYSLSILIDSFKDNLERLYDIIKCSYSSEEECKERCDFLNAKFV